MNEMNAIMNAIMFAIVGREKGEPVVCDNGKPMLFCRASDAKTRAREMGCKVVRVSVHCTFPEPTR